MTSVTQGVSDATFSIIVTAGLSLWIASLAAMWKVATLLSNLTSEIKTLAKQTQLNSANITRIQRRFNVPQATDNDIEDYSETG